MLQDTSRSTHKVKNKKNYNIKNLYAQKGFDLSDREKQIPKPMWREKNRVDE